MVITNFDVEELKKFSEFYLFAAGAAALAAIIRGLLASLHCDYDEETHQWVKREVHHH